jgi:hypothetical protein
MCARSGKADLGDVSMMRGPRIAKECRFCKKTYMGLVSRPQQVFCSRVCKKKGENLTERYERKKAAFQRMALLELIVEDARERGVKLETRLAAGRVYIVPEGTPKAQAGYIRRGRELIKGSLAETRAKKPKLRKTRASKPTMVFDRKVVGVDLTAPTLTARDICRLLGLPMPVEQPFKRRF